MKTSLTSISFLLILALVAVTGINAKVDTGLSFTVENDPELKIENWMIEDDYWSSSSVDFTVEVEEVLKIEQWMTDECYWK